MSTPGHGYVSTACYHGQCRGDADGRGGCRRTCKYCDTPCQHICHQGATIAPVPSWVDQARGIARELMTLGRFSTAEFPRDLLDRIENDPALFWLRGEEAPPGMGHS
jgi:hypothetical protein